MEYQFKPCDNEWILEIRLESGDEPWVELVWCHYDCLELAFREISLPSFNINIYQNSVTREKFVKTITDLYVKRANHIYSLFDRVFEDVVMKNAEKAPQMVIDDLICQNWEESSEFYERSSASEDTKTSIKEDEELRAYMRRLNGRREAINLANKLTDEGLVEVIFEQFRELPEIRVNLGSGNINYSTLQLSYR